MFPTFYHNYTVPSMCPYIWFLFAFVGATTFLATRSVAMDCSSPSGNVAPLYFPLSNCSTQAHGDVPIADSWGLAVALGDPPQELCVVPSMFTNSTFVPTVEVCNSDDTISFPTCTSRRGGLLDVSVSGANFGPIPLNDVPPDLNWPAVDPDNSVTEKGNISLRLPVDTSISQYPLKIFRGGQRHNAGHLGLASSSVLLQQISAHTGVVTGFGLDAGSQSTANPREGHLIVGGYDKTRVSASFKDYNISSIQMSRRICPLQVTITELVLSRPGVEDVILSSKGEQIPACIEPCKYLFHYSAVYLLTLLTDDVLFRLPERPLLAFTEATGFVNDTLPDPTEFYIVEPGLTYPSFSGFSGSLKFTLDNDFVVEIPNEELVHPLRGIAPDGTKILMPNTTELNIFRYVAFLDTAVLGKAFLSRVYVVVEYRSSGPIFRLAKSNSGSLPPNPVAFAPDCGHSGPTSDTMSTGAIIGTALGTFVAACLVVGLLGYLAYTKLAHRGGKREDSPHPESA
jgi:hypothetical protein